MATAFNLTAQINLRGPSNLRPIISDIKRQLGSVSANVSVKIDARSARSIDNITGRLRAMNVVLAESQSRVLSINQAFQSMSGGISSAQSSTRGLSSNLNATNQSLRQTSKTIQIARTEMEEFGKQSYLAIKRFAAFSLVTSGIFALTNAVTSGFKAFINFDRELIRLQQVSNKGTIGVRGLANEITNLAVNLGVSSEKLMNVATTLAQAGFSVQDTTVALQALAKTDLAPSFEDITKTTEGAIAAMRQFGLQASDLEASLGSINAVAAAFAVESSDIITAIQRTGGVFAAASKGISEGKDALNEFIAVFTSVRATTRESAETIATGLRTIFTRIQRGKTIESLREFGINLQDLEGKFVGPYEAIKRLSAALNTLDPRDVRFSSIVEELGGFRQIGKVIPLIQQFSTAQQALGVAQRGQNSLTDAQVIAQQSLANQLAKVREQFLALIRDVGNSTAFQGLFKVVLGLASGLISLAGAFKPILPILAIFGAIKGASALTQFGKGFFGSMNKGGGAGAVGSNLGSSLTGSKDKERNDATNVASDAIRTNTAAISQLTSAIQSLIGKIGSSGPKFNAGGPVRRFAAGGYVPGSGNRDTVPAVLTPGEFVIRKKAVETIGASNLQKMNKYAGGGIVEPVKYGFGGEILQQDSFGAAVLKGQKTLKDNITLSNVVSSIKNKEYEPKIEQNWPEGKTFNLVRQPLSKDVYPKFSEAIDSGLVAGVNRAVQNIKETFADKGVPIEVPAISRQYKANFLSGINDASRGNLFEEVIKNVQTAGVYSADNPRRPFDFTSGIGQADEIFDQLKGIQFIDAKASIDAASVPEMSKKLGNTIAEDNDLPGGEFGEVSLLDKIKRKANERRQELLNVSRRTKNKLDQTNIREALGTSTYLLGDMIDAGLIKKVSNSNRYYSLTEAFEQNPFAYGGLVQKLAFGGLAESADEMRGLMQGLYGNRTQEESAKQEKQFGKIALRKDGQSISATYFKNDTRSGQVSAYKLRDYLYYVGLSQATKGYGPKLYDAVMEAASEEGAMLTSDRNSVSGDAIRVWEYYFKNRGDVKKTPLKPDDWTRNQSLIDPKLFGKPETWPPANDPAWILQSGYSKSPSLINDPASVIRMNQQMQTQKFAKGGSAEDTVPALLTPGEFVINKDAAKRIGYSKLNQLNQADKLHGFNKGGVVGMVQKFASGGSAQTQITSYKQSREKEQIKLDSLRQRAESASPADRVVLDEEIQKSEQKINALTSKIDEVVNTYDKLKTSIAKSNQDLYAANQLLVEKAKRQYESKSGGKKWEDLSERSQTKIVRKARTGRYKDSSGVDMFEDENKTITEAETKVNRTKRKQSTKFGDTQSAAQLRESSLTPTEIRNRKKSDEAMIDYKARQQGTSSTDYKYQLAQQLGKKAYETQEMYAGRKEEMKAELVTRQDRFKNIGATIASAKAAAEGTGPEAEAAKTQLADASSRLAAEAENIAQEMRSLNPTLDMDKTADAARKVAKLLSEGKLDEAQQAMTDALGEVPDATDAMKIAMEKLARDLNIDVGTLQRTFDSGGDKKLLERQKFIQSREGERFGSLATFAPDMLKNFSQSRMGNVFGKGADFISGKGGKFSQFFANKLGGMSGVGAGLTVGAETLKNMLPKSVSSNPNAAGALGALSGGGSGMAMGAQLGFMVAGPVGAMVAGIGGAVIGGIQGFFSSKNQAILTNALENVAKTSGDLDMAFKKLEQSANNTNFDNAQKAFGNVITSSKDIETMAMTPSASLLGSGTSGLSVLGAAIGTAIAPGVGTAIGYLAGATIDYLSSPSAEQRQEAMGAMVQQSGANQQSANRLAQIELKKTSTADLNKMLDNLGKVSSSMDIITKQYADGMIKAAEAANGTANLTAAEKEKITVEAKARSALDAYMQKRKQSGATDEQITKEIEKNRNAAIEEGKAKLEADDELLKKQEAMARAVRKVAVESERLLDIYKRVGGAIDKMSFNIDNLIKQSDAFANTMRGEGGVNSPDRTSENILSNYSNYSMAEVEKEALNAANLLGGTKDANQMTNSVVAAKIIEDQLPVLLRETSGQDTDEIIAVLRTKLGSVFGEDSSVLDEALKQIDERLKSQGEDKSFRELSSEDLVKELSATLKAGAETTAKVIKAWNDGIAQAAELTNKYSEAILKSEQYIREANSIRINSENDLAKALGKSVGLNQQNRAFNEEILSLTQGIGPNGAGTLDPRIIGEFIKTESAKFNKGGEFDPSKRQSVANTEQAIAQQKATTEAQAKSQRAIKNASAALDKLASDGTLASNALSAIQESMALNSRATDTLTKLATSDGTELSEMMMDLEAYTRVASGSATNEDYGNLAFRQRAFRGLDAVSPLLPQGVGERVKAQMNLEMLRQTNPALLTAPIAMGLDANNQMVPRTVEQVLEAQMRGEATDPATLTLVQAYNDAINRQIESLETKADLERGVSQNILTKLDQIYTELKNKLDNVVDRSRAEAKADADSVKQDRQNELIDEFNRVAGLTADQKKGKTPQEIIDMFRESGQLDKADELNKLWDKINNSGDVDDNDLERMRANPPKPRKAADSQATPVEVRPTVGIGANTSTPNPGVGIGAYQPPYNPGVGIGAYRPPYNPGVGMGVAPAHQSTPPEVADPLHKVGEMADHATKPGSIYTHDIHIESILTNVKDLLTSLVTLANAQKSSSPASATGIISSQPSSISTISLDDKSIKTLDSFVNKFGEYVNQLSQFNLPSNIEIKGTFALSVNLTGADAFKEMGVNLKEEIINMFEPQLDYIWQRTNGALTKRPGMSSVNKTTKKR